MKASIRLPGAWSVAAIAAVVGSALGAGIATVEATGRPWRAGDFAVGALHAAGPRPVCEVPETLHAFGSIRMGGEGSHEFVINNSGDAPLELTRGATSCSCTVSDFEESEGGSAEARIVPPGGGTRLKVRWRGKGDGGPFRQQASVLTNDPRRPRVAFVVEGTVVPTHVAEPATVALPRLSAAGGERATVRILTFGKEPPQVSSVALGSGGKWAPFLKATAAPLDAAAIATREGATGGVAVDLEVRPGLPIGPLRETLRVVLRTPEEITVEVPIEGTVTGDLAVAGRAWDSTNQVVGLGAVSGRKGTTTELFLTAKGPHREAVKPVVKEVVPASLRVTVGAAAPVGNGAVIRIPLTLSIDPGSPPANHICSPQAPPGRIVLETGHPDSPTFTIPVCVSIGQ
jgi:hypothetical protein